MPSIYDFTVKLPDGKEQSLREYEGKPLLIVNTASKCGFTPQFAELQELYAEFKDQGFLVLGFPCSQFRNQEFDSMEETTAFCERNYSVTFPLYDKIDVNGKQESPLYTYLKRSKKGLLTRAIKWNFTKFLIDRNGNVIKRYGPTIRPSSIRKDILRVL